MAGCEISELDGVFNGKIIKLNGGFSAAIAMFDYRKVALLEWPICSNRSGDLW